MGDEVEMTTETVKAVQEVAKTTGKAIDAGRDFGGFLNQVFGRPIQDAVGLLLGDKLAARRIENAIYNWERLETLFLNTKRRLQARGVNNFRPVPPKVALPLLEYATVEHEDDLHVLWANLLATGMDADADEIHRKYVTTLGEMTSNDALVLATMLAEAEQKLAKKETRDSSVTYGPGVDGTYSHDEVAVVTLNRLGLIEPAYIKFQTYVPGGHNDGGDYGAVQDDVSIPGDLGSVTITAFGRAFAVAIGFKTET